MFLIFDKFKFQIRPKRALHLKNGRKNTILLTSLYYVHIRGVVTGGAGGAMATPDFGRSVNPISTRGADVAHEIILAPPDFQTFLRP